MTTYRIVRKFLSGRSRTVKRGLTLEEAQKHCQDPETSYKTCTSSTARQRSIKNGPWFDVFYKE